MRQKSEQLELALEARGEAPHGPRSGEARTTSDGDERSGGDHRLMEQVVARANALAALKRVKQNKGSPGMDGMTVKDLSPYLAAHGETSSRRSASSSCSSSSIRSGVPSLAGSVSSSTSSSRSRLGAASSFRHRLRAMANSHEPKRARPWNEPSARHGPIRVGGVAGKELLVGRYGAPGLAHRIGTAPGREITGDGPIHPMRPASAT